MRFSDGVARSLITVGGIGTIVAVLTVCIFLVWTVLPLFSRPDVQESQRFKSPWREEPLKIGIDEYQIIGWALMPDGTLHVFRADNGERLEERKLLEGPDITAVSFAAGSESSAAFGFEDGSVRIGSVGFSASFLPAADVTEAMRSLDVGRIAVHKEGVVERISLEQFRWQRIAASFAEPIKGANESPITLIDHIAGSDGTTYATLSADDKLHIHRAKQRRNLLTDELTFRLTTGELAYAPKKGRRPTHLLLSGLGDNVFLAWDDGDVVRYDTRSITKPQVAERLDLVPKESAKLTSLAWLLGRSTLLAGDSLGGVSAWFRTKPAGAETADDNVLTLAHVLPSGDAPVTSLTSSARSRVCAAGFADGAVRIYHVTSGRQLALLDADQGEPVSSLAMSPKENGLLGAMGSAVARWSVDLKHPSATLATLFRPIWYEGYEGPRHVWQSSSGTVEEEPKYGLMPLIFGTLKATFYSLLFGVPLALLAAIYTSEFLHPRFHAKVKPLIELMASLPSVVLGFLAALVIAPLVEGMVPAVITSFVTVPLAFLTGAYLWQLLPQNVGLALVRWRFLFILAMLPVGLALAWFGGPLVERVFYAGNIKAWLDNQVGSSVGGWMLLLLPLAAIGTLRLVIEVNVALRRVSTQWSRAKVAAVDLFKFVLAVLLAIGMAWGASLLLDLARFDLRGALVDTYDQRNALVVGFLMGFAIIPIIYTIADDALTAVPQHLRSASLGAGATPWQTAVRIVIPTAMSGLFSAVMIGLGRAVGETMIVLMAAGNTPVMKMNIFEGFRTLSANLAVELPEAVQGSTHYLTLYLAALVLFAMTFVVNTVAEVVRLRFRRRAYEL